MIDLSKTKTLVTHANCPDGVASAILVKDALPDVRVLFMGYQTKELAELQPEEGMLFCDFSPPRERAKEFVDAGALCLDHHKSAREVVEAFGDRGVFADEKTEPGVCGAVLAFQHVWLPIKGNSVGEVVIGADIFARLAGIRDTWQRNDRNWEIACVQAETLRFYPWAAWEAVLKPHQSIFGRFLEHMWAERLDVGRILIQKHEEAVKRAVASAHRFELLTPNATAQTFRDNTLRVLCFEGTHLTSDAAELVGDKFDLVVGFGYVVDEIEKMKFSLRSHTHFDCAALAKKHGGGGHTRAAGFDKPVAALNLDPYHSVKRLLHFHLYGEG